MAPPSNVFGVVGRFFGNTVSAATGYAFGVATGPVLAPAVEVLRQQAWQTYPHRIPDTASLVTGVVTGKLDEGAARSWAKQHGYDTGSFDALLAVARAALPLGTAVSARRRGIIDGGELHTVYERAGIARSWWPTLDKLVPDILSPGELAAAIHRGLIPDPGLLKGEQPSGPFNVEAYPVYPIDADKEAAGSGYDHDRLGVLVGLQGLPMGTHEAAQALFREIITHGDYIRAFNESNSRNEWAQAVLDQSRQIPTARDFLENALRGYRTLTEALKGASLHGMSAEHATMIYQNQGRPMAIRQITQALSRGGKFKPEPGEIKDPYDAAIVEGNLKPAYYDLAKALRYTMPSAFVLRSLVQTGAMTEATAAQRLKDSGWVPDDADAAAKNWATATGGTSQKWADRARTRVFTAAWSDFLDGNSDEPALREALDAIGVSGAEADTVVRLATWERDNVNRELTQAQILKLYKKGVWPLDKAHAALIDRGMRDEDATDLLTAQ